MTWCPVRVIVPGSLFLAITMTCAAAEQSVRVAIPREVAAQAAARAHGDAYAPLPVLVLEDVAIGRGEGMTLNVFGPADRRTKRRPLLAVTGLVGAGSDGIPSGPAQAMTLVIPLNDRAVPLVAGKKTITLTLQIENGRRPPLQFRRAFFRVYKKSS
jgi:hypothetical protein